MKILHTADWHLGSRLDGHDRTDDLFRQVERICSLTEEHAVDLLLIAGDVFERRTQLPQLTKRLAEVLREPVRRGLHILLVPGNHDDREHFRMMHALLSLEPHTGQRIHIAQTRCIREIGGVQFAIIPYPLREMLEPYRADASGVTQRNITLSSAYANLVRSVSAELDPSRPAVFVGHVTVAGVTTPSDRELTYDDDLRLGREDLPDNVAYMALGHIHQAQYIPHSVPCHYSGSIERLNMGERGDSKLVLLVDVPPFGPACVQELPLDVTPFYDLRLPAADLEMLPASYLDLDRAFVRLHLECQPGDDPAILQRRARELCPRCLNVDCSGEGLTPASAQQPATPRDYLTTALDYLRQVYADDPDLPELEKRASALIQEVDYAAATN